MGYGKAALVMVAMFFLLLIPSVILMFPLMGMTQEMGILGKTGVAISVAGIAYSIVYPLFVFLAKTAYDLTKDVGA